MARQSLFRIVTFTATHRYGRAEWSEARNRDAFGDQAVSHGHEFRVEVAVSGPPDPDTGFVTDLGALDEALHEEVLVPLSGRDLNRAIPEVAAGTMQPSTESLAAWVHGRLAPRIRPPARLERVRVWESDDLGGEFLAPEESA